MTERTDRVVSTLTEAFADLMAADPTAFRSKFRTMAQDPFAFYRGSACLFYADVTDGGPFAGVDDAWVGAEGARRIWIQGDLHAGNGTYLDAGGRLVFDVNDFDEAYVGHWTWDVLRLCASLGLLGWQKALPDESIDDLVETYVRAYLDWVHHYVDAENDTDWALTLSTARWGARGAPPRPAAHPRLPARRDHRRGGLQPTVRGPVRRTTAGRRRGRPGQGGVRLLPGHRARLQEGAW